MLGVLAIVPARLFPREVDMLVLWLASSASSQSMGCDPAVEGSAYAACQAYCEVLDCTDPSMAGEPVCVDLLTTWQVQ
jgi:hypothetical protein